MSTQLITPNPNIACTPGMCLVYVRETFGIDANYPTATANWEASHTKHQDTAFPDLWVPVWFSLQDEPAGHVALRQPDGSIWSSSHPTDLLPVHHQSMEDLESYYSGRLQYLGWTEDIEGVAIASIAAFNTSSTLVGEKIGTVYGNGELRKLVITPPTE